MSRHHKTSRFTYSPSIEENEERRVTTAASPTIPKTVEDPVSPPKMFESEELGKLALFAGVGVLAVLVIDAIVRLACRKQQGAPMGGGNTIVIDGKRYIQI